jgi:hypothetical protein
LGAAFRLGPHSAALEWLTFPGPAPDEDMLGHDNATAD